MKTIRPARARGLARLVDNGLSFDLQCCSTQIRPLIPKTIALFGTDRYSIASDAPPTGRSAAPTTICVRIERSCPISSESEQRDLSGRNADRIHRLGLPLPKPRGVSAPGVSRGCPIDLL